MKYTLDEMITIATDAESRSDNPKYKKIMQKFDRVLDRKTTCVRLSLDEKDLISYMYEKPSNGIEESIVAKLYK